jgi:hypothetical protein
MKKVCASLLLVMSTMVFAEPVQVNKPVVCGNTADVMKELKDDYKEYPVFLGQTKDTSVSVSLFVNLDDKKDKSWTLIEFNESVACVISMGKKWRTFSLPESGKGS